MNIPSPKRASTFFLKTVLIFIGCIALALCVFSLPNVWIGAAREWPMISARLLYPGLIGIYATIIPFLLALYQAFRLLRLIDRHNAFSKSSIDALRNISFCAVAMTLLYFLAMPLVVSVADSDDAPGLVLISFAFACAPLVIATFAAVLQKLVRNALDMKTENDFTI